MALLFAAIDRNIHAITFVRYIIRTLLLIPAFGLFSFIVYKSLKKPLKIVLAPVKDKLPQIKQSLLVCCDGHIDDRAQNEEQGNTKNNDDEAQLPDRVVHHELYDAQEDQPTY